MKLDGNNWLLQNFTSYMTYNIIAFGELLWDLLPGGKALGGAPANFVFRVNHFGNNGRLITRLGNDELGKEAMDRVREIGLPTGYVQVDEDVPTGTVDVFLDKQGIPDFTINTGVAFDEIEFTSDMKELASEAHCIYYGTLVQRGEKSRESLFKLIDAAPKALKFCDINLRKDCYTRETLHESLQRADVVKINDDEIMELGKIFTLIGTDPRSYGEDLMMRYDLGILLVTMGPKGALCITQDGEFFYDSGYEVKVKDTVGSGDAFSAGFIHILLKTGDVHHALNFGNALGALAATTAGATVPISESEVMAFMRKYYV